MSKKRRVIFDFGAHTSTPGKPPVRSSELVLRESDSLFEEATYELYNAARDFTKEWLKVPSESSFSKWFDACERLERAALTYATAKAQNDPSSATRLGEGQK